ncbi:MAG TPA: hypothetical protein VIG08_14730 [Gemmatimonadales bacterium]|jgi:hypothetical protein
MRRIVYSSALIVPALLLVSCNDTADVPASPSTPGSQLSTPTPAVHRLNLKSLRVPKVSAAEFAAAVKEDAANSSVTIETTGDKAPHDPTIAGQTVQCIDGDEGTGIPGFHGEATKFRTNKGCELNTVDGDADPNNNAAYVVTTQNKLSGKKLTQVQQLNFYYAGGPAIGGNPRLSIPIDEDGDGSFEFGFTPTDEQYAFIDALGCNDGDAYVGVVKGDDDPVCNVNYKGVDYPTFSAFEAAFTNGRIARNADAATFIALDQPTHYLIYRVNLN